MKLPLVKLIGIVLVVSLACGLPSQSQANVNISGAACQRYGGYGGSPDLLADISGLYNSGQFGAYAVCGVPHSPLAATATSFMLYVDGDNWLFQANPYSSAQCIVYSYDYNGTFLGSTSQISSSSVQHFDMLLSLPAAQVPYWAYTSVFCSLPPTGLLRGVTVLQ